MTRRARILVPGDLSAVSFARDRVLTHVRAWGVSLDEERREAVKLVASELITNAVVHGGSSVTVGLYLDEGRLLLVVHDGNKDEPERRYVTGDDEAGRGLALVESLATHHGWEPTANGKRVWAEFEVPATRPAGRGDVLRRRVKAAARHAAPGSRSPVAFPEGRPAPSIAPFTPIERITTMTTTQTLEKVELGRFFTVSARRFEDGHGAPEMFSTVIDAEWHRLLGAPRSTTSSCGGETTPPPGRRSGRVEAGGSLIRGSPGRVEAASTTSGRAGTARRPGFG